MNILKKLFGTRNQRVLKGLAKVVANINAWEAHLQPLTDAELKNKTDELQQRYQQGTTLVALLPEAFAVVREAAIRTLGQRHFDEQLMGGIVLHEGKIAEMRTGEGKTLVATLPAYLNALTQQAVHVVTVNDYLAQRDAAWMGKIYNFLGLTVGVIIAGQSYAEKKAAYACDIIYGTNNEFGFDYLRDNMVTTMEEKVQRGLAFAIVDEVDSILIDEARTPLIISGPTEDSSALYISINKIIPKLRQQEADEGDFTLDEKIKQAFLTEEGHQHVEELFIKEGLLQAGESLYDVKNIKLMHHLNAALRANTLFHRDVDYIVHNGEVVIVDEHTGRTMEGRRWSDGLHQAIEAKEGVPVLNENQTLASITFQNYFRLYAKLAGMTGTADTEAYEFQQIYGLEVVVVPTHKPMIRQDLGDQIYLSAQEKFNAVIADIKERSTRGQPLLVGTASIETSEHLSALLTQAKIPHQVLNAKQHAQEAKIIAQAGRPGTVTIATNMAGRGTDIVLGGNLEAELAAATDKTPEAIKSAWEHRHQQVVAAGGLHVIGSERHESRRIDNQLRGRAGRQGDPGSSRFYLSLEDNLMRIFASPRVAGMMKKLGMQENEAIEHPLISRAVENAQRKVEGHNFDMRKHLLEFDDVANEQRQVIYEQRDDIMLAPDIADTIVAMRIEVVHMIVQQYMPPNTLEDQWQVAELELSLQRDFGVTVPLQRWLAEDNLLQSDQVVTKIVAELKTLYQTKEAQVGATTMRQIEKALLLQVLDTHWKEHLAAMDHLREGIHLRGYAQQDPKQEYKRESFKMFTAMLNAIKRDVTLSLFALRLSDQDLAVLQHAETTKISAANQDQPVPQVGRNEACPCGSSKKYKQCHGKVK